MRKDTSLGRFYEIEGRQLPSVTSILSIIGKPALVKWAANEERKFISEAAADLYEDTATLPKMGRAAYIKTLLDRVGKVKAFQRTSQKAVDIGSQVHARVEYAIRKELGQEVGPEPPMSEDAWSSFSSWENWRKGVDLKPLFIEQTVYNLTDGYAGTLDLIAEVGGQRALIDWKTSKAIYPEYSLQLAAYSFALRDMKHEVPRAGYIVRLPKTAGDSFEAKEFSEGSLWELYSAFLHAKELWEWNLEHEKAYQQRSKQ